MPDPRPISKIRRSQLRRLLERPDAAARVKRAVVPLLSVSILSIGIIGLLVIWHLVRRGRLIRDRLDPPRAVNLIEFDSIPRPKPSAMPDDRDPLP